MCHYLFIYLLTYLFTYLILKIIYLFIYLLAYIYIYIFLFIYLPIYSPIHSPICLHTYLPRTTGALVGAGSLKPLLLLNTHNNTNFGGISNRGKAEGPTIHFGEERLFF